MTQYRCGILWVIIMVVCSGVLGYFVAHKINPPVSREYVDGYFKDVFLLLGKHTATWDRYIQANEMEKKIFWSELDSIRRELNIEFKPRVEIDRGGIYFKE